MKYARTALAALLLTFVWASVQASNLSSVDSTGKVHTITVETWEDEGMTGGTVLVHVVQFPDGSMQFRTVTGTGDFALEKDPFIDIDPVTDEPVMVWARSDENGGTLQISRYNGSQWVEPTMVWSGNGHNLEPEIDIRSNLLHLVWMNDSGPAPLRYRLSLERTSLQQLFGPELLPVTDSDMIPTEGQSPDFGESPVVPPDSTLSYFSSILPPTVPGEPGSMFTWGIRDEPVPIVYFEALQLPVEMQRIRERNSEWIADRFVTWFTSGSSLYYTTLHNGYWDDLRIISLTDDRTSAEALRMIEDLIQRDTGHP